MYPDTVLQFSWFGLTENVNAFLVVFIMLGGGIGLLSRKLSIGVMGAILVYTHIVIKTDLFIFDAVLYVVLVIILLWASAYVVSGYLNAGEEGAEG